MPIEFLYTDSELIKMQAALLDKSVLTSEELKTLGEINEYMNTPA